MLIISIVIYNDRSMLLTIVDLFRLRLKMGVLFTLHHTCLTKYRGDLQVEIDYVHVDDVDDSRTCSSLLPRASVLR